jgi:ribosome maturation factor RimP
LFLAGDFRIGIETGMASAQNSGTLEQLTGLGERAVEGTSIEVLEMQLRGAGKARLLRVYIDKPGGVTHEDCQLVSERLGKLLDDADAVPGESYTLEVSSPGVERRLSTARDFERVIGQKVRLLLTEPVDGQPRLEGKLAAVSAGSLELEIPGSDEPARVPLDKIRKANLKFEW